MYKAKIVTISKINPIQGKDRIVAAEIEQIPGLQVVVGKNVKPGLIMDYKYGCNPGECREFVYKLDVVKDGVRTTKSWDYTVKRCEELGLQTVPKLDEFVHCDVEKTLARVNTWLANDEMKASTIDSTHLIEGVCVRVEEYDNMGFVKEEWNTFKHKSFIFGVLEGYNRENMEVEAEELEVQEE